MSSVIFAKKNVASLIDHHIALLKRFDITGDSEFSIIYFSYENVDHEGLSSIFQKILRQTDAIFQDETSSIAMLPGTSWNGASELLSGIQDFLNQPLNDNIVTYPFDGDNSEELLGRLKRLVKENCKVDLDLDQLS